MIQVGTFNYLFRLIGALSSPSSAHLQNCPRFLSTTNVATASFNACAKAAGAVRHAQLIANLDLVDKEISAELNVTLRTIKEHRGRVMQKIP
jgi:hypothetical protein